MTLCSEMSCVYTVNTALITYMMVHAVSHAMGQITATVQVLFGRQLFFSAQMNLSFSKTSKSSEANPTSVSITLDYFLDNLFCLLNITVPYLL